MAPDNQATRSSRRLSLNRYRPVFAWNFIFQHCKKLLHETGATSVLHRMSNMKTSSRPYFVYFLTGARKSRITVGLAIITFGLVGFAQAATDFCQTTAQDALQGCQD